MAVGKDTIYIEADDEITSVIEKVITAKSQIVAVVLPKRPTVFQSVVNVKLLKKAAAETKKKIVLITSESGIATIAGTVGVHVATSLTSKPIIPKKSSTIKSTVATVALPEDIADSVSDSSLSSLDDRETDTTIEDTVDKDTIQIDNTDREQDQAQSESPVMLDNTKKKKAKFKIPDFGSFRLRLGLGITAVILLVSGWIYAFFIAPRATITINTDTSNVKVSVDFTVDTAQKELDETNLVVPAEKVEVTKEDKATVEATGEKDVGDKATGTVILSARVCGGIAKAKTVKQGTGVSSGGHDYILQDDVSFSLEDIDGECLLFSADNEAGIVAINAGADANLDDDSAFDVAGRSDVSGTGSASGGTTKLVKVVSDGDITKARDQLKGTATADAIKELKTRLNEKQLQALADTLTQASPEEKVSAAVNTEASEVTVTQKVTYHMLGVKSENLAKILEKKVGETEEAKQKNVRNNGLDKANFQLKAKNSDDQQVVTMQAIAILGPTFDEQAIKNEVVGKKRGVIESMLEAREGVKSVSVDYSPMWVMSTPKSINKITIVINEVSSN